ncbi:MAG: ABC transporter substrate-binding protein [Gemmatimonadales bacterium]
MPRRRWSIVAASLLACANPAARRGDTVIFASGADLESINPLLTMHPLAHQVQRYVLLTTLVRYDSALRVEPYLAKSWSWSPDSTSITFALHAGVRWHDGAPTTAHDVTWTLDAARDPATGYPRFRDLASISGVLAPDDSTVRIVFDGPQSGIPDVLTDLAILPEHLFRGIAHADLRSAPWNQVPLGNGPFRFVSHTPNRRWVFDADSTFPTSLGGPPRIHRLVIAVVDEPTTKLAALTSGELDFAGIQPAHASFVRRDPQLHVIEYPLLYTYCVIFNTRRAPFTDPAVRRAVSLALDRRAIVDGYLFGFATPATGPIASDTGAPPPDIAGARALLAGRPIRFELLTVGSGEAALEQMIQSQLARAGITVTIRQLELASYLDRVNGPGHDFEAAVLGFSGDADHGELAPLLATSGIDRSGPPDTLLRIFSDSVPAAFLYHARGVQGANRRVTGVRMDYRGEMPSILDWRVTR